MAGGGAGEDTKQIPVTRLAFSRRQVAGRGSTFRLRPAAFMPYRGELSVFRIDGLDDRGVWAHLVAHAQRPGRRMHGRGDLRLAELRGDTLDLDLDDSPPRHGNLIGWPADRGEQLALARELATVARAVPAPGK